MKIRHSTGRRRRLLRGAVLSKYAFMLALLVGLCLLPPPHASASSTRPMTLGEAEAKADYIYKFTHFVTWPEGALGAPDDPIRICVSDPGDFERVLRQALYRRTAQNRELDVHPFVQGRGARNCNILFISGADLRAEAETLQEAADRPILTIGESPSFTRHGGMVGLEWNGTRLRLLINRRTVEQRGLRISSQVLRLASLVGEVED